MILHVHLLVYSPSLLRDMNWGGGSFAWSHNPTAVYMTFLPARRYASAGYRDRNVSVCHVPVLCQNEES